MLSDHDLDVFADKPDIPAQKPESLHNSTHFKPEEPDSDYTFNAVTCLHVTEIPLFKIRLKRKQKENGHMLCAPT